MRAKKWVRNLVIGENKFIESYGDFKQAMLSGHVALMGAILCVLYCLMDVFVGTYDNAPVFFLAAAFFIISVKLHRNSNHTVANCIMLTAANVTNYLVAASESYRTGGYVFFVGNCIVAFAVFNRRQRLLAIAFCGFSYALFILAYFVDYSFLPRRTFTPETEIFYMVSNFTAVLLFTVMCVHLLTTLNHYNSTRLIQSNEQLTKANTELDRFVYSTSHDLRAPLTSIMGLLNITEKSTDPRDIKKYMGMMKAQLHALDKFIKDITDYSRNNRLEILTENVRLNELSEQVWESLKFTPEAARITYHADISDDVIVHSDKNRLKMILSNLISNAIRYHDPRKEEPFIRLHADVRDGIFYLKIEDNGQGIASEYHSRVFDMFFRANEQSKGSGLGLYIVREALVKLSGSIDLESSSPGIGSVFTVRLPVA